MQYLGGKFKHRKEISSVLEYYYAKDSRLDYYEPFCGSCWVTTEVIKWCEGSLYLSDINLSLISLWKYILDDNTSLDLLPTYVTEEYYQEAKQLEDTNPIKAFVGFGASFSGKYFGGYARDYRKQFRGQSDSSKNSLLKKQALLQDYREKSKSKEAKNSLLKKQTSLQEYANNIYFDCKSYLDIDSSTGNSLIYCDIPYRNTTQYFNVWKEEDYIVFWNWVKEMSKLNTVLVSEYQAPEEFTCVWEKETNVELRNSNNEREIRTEKLFKL